MHGTCRELMKPLLCFNSRWIFYSLYIQPRYSVTYPGLQRQYQLFYSVSFHPWAPVAHGREVFSCPQHMHGSRAAAGFWEQALGSAPLYSWLLPCLFFQEDPVRADVVLPHAQRHLSVRTWPGACSSVPSQELLCSVANVSWSYHCRTPCG